jgi:DNA-binding transcriptional MerR regulator
MRTGQLATLLGVHPNTIRLWCSEYRHYLSEGAAGSPDRTTRELTDHDALVLATVADLRGQGLARTQIVEALDAGRLVAALPAAPTPDETEARARVALVPAAERDRYLDRIQTLEVELNELRAERDRAIQTWQSDTSRLNDRIAALERELGEARGALSERLPVAVMLRVAAVFIVGMLILVALAVVYLGSRGG